MPHQAQAVRRPKVTGKEAACLSPDQVRSLLVAASAQQLLVARNHAPRPGVHHADATCRPAP